MNSDIRTRIIEEATHLFGQRGYGSVSVRELVEAVGVTKPTLYYHFGSKEGLFLATAQHHLDGMDCFFRSLLQDHDSLRESLESLLLANVNYAAENPDVIRFLMTVLHQVDHGQPEFDMMSMDATLMRYLGGAFFKAVDRGEVSRDIDVPLAAINFLGILRAWTLAAFHGAPIPRDFHRTIVHQFIHGIGPS